LKKKKKKKTLFRPRTSTKESEKIDNTVLRATQRNAQNKRRRERKPRQKNNEPQPPPKTRFLPFGGGSAKNTKLEAERMRQWRRCVSSAAAAAASTTNTNAASSSTRHKSALAYHESQFARRGTSGLLGVSASLTSPHAFASLCEQAEARIDAARNAVCAAPRLGLSAAQVVALYDEISEVGCALIDPAELCRVAHPDAAWRAAATAAVARLVDAFHRLNVDHALYAAFRDAVSQEPLPSDAMRMYVDNTLAQFRRLGIDRAAPVRDRLRALNSSLTQLTLEYVNPDAPFAASSLASSPAARRRAYLDALASPSAARAALSLEHVFAKRCEIAHLLDARSYAELEARSNAFATGPHVLAFLERAAHALRHRELAELALLAATKRRLDGSADQLDAWDVRWLRERAAPHDPAALEAEAAEYLSVRNCLNGLDLIAREVFGLALDVVPPLVGELPSRDMLKTLLRDLATNETLGVLYFDLATRPGKEPLAATFPIRFAKQQPPRGAAAYPPSVQLPPCELLRPTQHESDGGQSPPLPRLAIVMSCESERRLTHAELETLCHEFGHALSGLLSRTQYQAFAGTRLALAYAEVPSALLERFAWQHSVLERFALHHRTQRPMPADLLNRLRACRRQFSGLDDQKQVLVSIFDQHVHAAADADTAPRDWTAQLYWQLQEKHTQMPVPHGAGVPPLSQLRPHAAYSHLLSYGCNYHAYLYSRSISAALWERFFAREPFNRAAGDALRREMLSRGGEREPMQVIRTLLDKDGESIDAILDDFVSAIASDR
jgi:Zn-dependent oligopeptidase